ncbi:Uncharacterised protein [Mycolicibacterium fortuitum]|uniref:Uncharacterized protein n=1 Tax=Mycolicibacterium fortuitum TaxID=1766 RepID=A0A378WEG4_MYCFO|nr:Uncharacterised protein [Mycolicibacterium fortuitum]
MDGKLPQVEIKWQRPEDFVDVAAPVIARTDGPNGVRGSETEIRAETRQMRQGRRATIAVEIGSRSEVGPLGFLRSLVGEP